MRNRLKEWRKTRGLTQTQLAEAAGTAYQTVQKLENGTMELTVGWMARLAPPLKIKAYELVNGSEKAPSLNSRQLAVLTAFNALDPEGQMTILAELTNAALLDGDPQIRPGTGRPSPAPKH